MSNLPTMLQPEGWARPKGYSNGMSATGKHIFVGGQIGWNKDCKFEVHDLPGQVRQTLQNIVDVLKVAGAGPEHITSMTWYLTSKTDYVKHMKEIGEAYREIIGRNFPAMAVVQVLALVEDEALIEIQANAVV